MREDTEASSRFFKIALAACPSCGAASFSWRCKEALEAQGHTVFLFTPALQPSLFDGLSLRSAVLERFLDVQDIDFLLCGDGVIPEGPCLIAGSSLGLLSEGTGELRGREGLVRRCGFGFAIAAGARCAAYLREERLADRVVECAPVADRAWVESPLANGIAFEPGLVCFQDATPTRIDLVRERLERVEGLAGRVRCLGRGWPEEWAVGVERGAPSSSVAYAVRSSVACLAFEREEGARDALWTDFAHGLVLAVGCPVLEERDFGGLDSVGCLSMERKELAAKVATDLETELDRAFSLVVEDLKAEGRSAGSSSPRRIVVILGYFGMGNFGDEYILQTIDERLRTWHEGASVVAVSENPAHTLENRGVYAVSLREKAVLDRALAYASTALVVAGLLFDQGIRWTMGKAELVSSLRHSDIPGIAGFCLLASLNEVPILFYGVGAGPLEVPDGQALVRLIGRLGALFLTRDEDTAQLLRHCGVDSHQVMAKADAAFLGAPAQDDGAVSSWLAESGIDTGCHQLIAVSLRDYESLPADFAERVARAFIRVSEKRPQVRFALCVLDPSDRALAEHIMEAMGSSSGVAQVFDEGNRLDRLCALLARAHGGFSMRYHCSLILNSYGVPCVGLGYLPKVVSLYRDMGCDRLLLPVGADVGAMEGALTDMLSDYEGWRQVVGGHARHLRELSEQAEGMLHEQVEQGGVAREGAVSRALFLESRALADLELLAQRECAEARCVEQRERAERAERERDEILASHSFRLGDALMRVPRALRECWRRTGCGSW